MQFSRGDVVFVIFPDSNLTTAERRATLDIFQAKPSQTPIVKENQEEKKRGLDLSPFHPLAYRAARSVRVSIHHMEMIVIDDN